MRSMLVDPIIDIRRFVQQALLEDKPMILFGKSVNQLSKLVRDHGYQPLVARSTLPGRPSSCPRTPASATCRSSPAASC